MATLVFGCLIWIPIAVFAVCLVHWMIGQDIDVITGLVGLMVLAALGITAIKPPIPIASPLSFAAVVATGIGLPFVRAAMNQRELRSIDIDGIHRAYEGLASRPGNILSIFKLAQHVYKIGLPGHAITLADSVLPQMPISHFRDEHRLVARWRKAGIPPESLNALSCVDCGTMCAAGQTHCPSCGARFLYDRARGRFIGKGVGPKLIAVWLALVGCLAGIPAASTLPPLLAMLSIVAIMVAAVVFIVVAFRKRSGAAPA